MALLESENFFLGRLTAYLDVSQLYFACSNRVFTLNTFIQFFRRKGLGRYAESACNYKQTCNKATFKRISDGSFWRNGHLVG